MNPSKAELLEKLSLLEEEYQNLEAVYQELAEVCRLALEKLETQPENASSELETPTLTLQ